MLLLIILLQGIWLPLHGYSFESTPFWAGVFMLPLTVGFVIFGPFSGWLSDRYGARWISTIGMILIVIAFLILASLPYNFDYPVLGIALFIMGCGNGMFAAPNTTAIMNSVPREDRGVASGMVSTLMNTGFVMSMGMFFTIVVVNLTRDFPPVLATALTTAGAGGLVTAMTAIPPTGMLFAAFLGINPVQSVLTGLAPAVVATVPVQTITTLTGTTWFPTTLAQVFMSSLRFSFYVGAALAAVAALLSALRGPRYVHESNEIKISELPVTGIAGPENKKQE
jgi:MFS family permease